MSSPSEDVMRAMVRHAMEAAMRSIAKTMREMAHEAAGIDGEMALLGFAEAIDRNADNVWPVQEEPFQ